ncbi:MAG: hypothetical protein OXI87_14200, partial [Albidovulum sp.]|nr:hypothetical protein [Albidovulum sp.]
SQKRGLPPDSRAFKKPSTGQAGSDDVDPVVAGLRGDSSPAARLGLAVLAHFDVELLLHLPAVGPAVESRARVGGRGLRLQSPGAGELAPRVDQPRGGVAVRKRPASKTSGGILERFASVRIQVPSRQVSPRRIAGRKLLFGMMPNFTNVLPEFGPELADRFRGRLS